MQGVRAAPCGQRGGSAVARRLVRGCFPDGCVDNARLVQERLPCISAWGIAKASRTGRLRTDTPADMDLIGGVVVDRGSIFAVLRATLQKKRDYLRVWALSVGFTRPWSWVLPGWRNLARGVGLDGRMPTQIIVVFLQGCRDLTRFVAVQQWARGAVIQRKDTQ